MITVAEVVEDLIKKSPFLEEAIADSLINVSSLARRLKPEIEDRLKKEVKNGAIVMAINRLSSNNYHKVNKGIKYFVNNMGDVVVRSNLHDYTFANSETLIDRQTELLDYIGKEKDVFFTFSQGVHETTMILSSGIMEKVEEIFKGERLMSKMNNLASITIKLPEGNTEITGIYYFILKKIAWEGISIIEVISTTHEFTIVVEDSFIDQTFSILMNMKKNG